MTGRMPIIFIMLLSVLVVTASSGCMNEEKSTTVREIPIPEVTGPDIETNVPEITIDSYYLVYKGNNLEKTDEYTDRSYNFTENYYIAYHLIIKNDGVETLNFILDDLQLSAGDQIFTHSNISDHFDSILDVWSAFEKENKLHDMILNPNQTMKGIIVFDVKNYDVFLDRSFALRYQNTPVTSTLFNESVSTLTIAESYDYAPLFGILPYKDNRDPDYDPEINYYWIYANWVNRSIFEYYKKTDPEYMSNEKAYDLPYTDIAYIIQVIPERNITVFQDDRPVHNMGYYQENRFHIVDDKGIEVSNKSIMRGSDYGALAVRKDQTYQLYFTNYPEMNFSNVTVVRFSFKSNYGWGLSMRMTYNNQDIIFNENQEIVLARYDKMHIVS